MSYDSAGTYTVILTITNDFGCVHSDTTLNYVTVTDPMASFTVNDTFSCLDTSQFDFTNYSTATPGFPLTYTWDFGDGTTSNDSNVTITHDYLSAGVYTVSLMVMDSNGCADTLISPGLVEKYDIIAAFGTDTAVAPCPPLLVSFFDSSSSDVTGWQWDFGDSSSSALQFPSHNYIFPGVYDITLVVFNDEGCTDTVFSPDYINLSGTAGTFTFDADTGCIPYTVTFIASAVNTALYHWDFGDGVTLSTASDTVVYTYTTVGAKYPALILDDGLGCLVPVPSPDSIYLSGPPTVDFTSDTSLLCGPGNIQFTDLSSSDRPIVSWLWDFGDGTTSTVQNPLHPYAGVGPYTVSLTVVNDYGCTNSLIQTAYFFVGIPPEAGFTLSPDTVCLGNVVSFTDTSTFPFPSSTRPGCLVMETVLWCPTLTMNIYFPGPIIPH